MALTLNGTTGISGIAGSEGTPALQGNNDANTGYFFAADTLGLSTAGTERLRIGSSGEMYIGTTSWPTGTMAKAAGRVLVGGGGDLTLWNETNSAGGVASFKLACKEGGDATKIGYVQFFGGTENTSDQKGFLKINVSDASGSGQERLRITSGGDLRLGLDSVANVTDSAHYIMTLTGKSGQTGAGAIAFRDPSANTDGFIFADSGNLFITADYSSATADSSIRFRIDGSSEKLRIDSSGRLIQRYSAAPYDNRAATFQSSAGIDSTYIAIVNTETNGTSGILFGDHAGQAAGNYTGYINYQHNNDEMRFMTNGGNERFMIGSGGDVTITDGNLKVVSGHGINFHNYATSGNPSSNLLDDYEEGTWTPSYSAGSATTLSVSAAGRYTKIGRQVLARFEMKTGNTNNVSGQIKITGLPFTSASDSVYGSPVCFNFVRDWATNFGTNLRGGVDNGGTTISLFVHASNADESTTYLQGSDMAMGNAAENYMEGVAIYTV